MARFSAWSTESCGVLNPYFEPDRLVTVWNVRCESIPDLEDLPAGATCVEAFGADLVFPNTLTVDGRTHAVNLTALDSRTFPLLASDPCWGAVSRRMRTR